MRQRGETMRQRTTSILLLISAVVIGMLVLSGGARAETLYVKSKTAKLRAGKTSLDPVVLDLKLGEPLDLLRTEGSWIEVRTAGGVKGWLPVSNTTTVRPGRSDDDLAKGECFPQTEASDVTASAGARGIGDASRSLAPVSPMASQGRRLGC